MLSSSGMIGAGFIDAATAYVNEHVAEESRRKEILSDVTAMESELKNYSGDLQDSAEKMLDLNEDHNSSRESFENILNQLNRSRAATQEKLLDKRFDVREKLTQEEWSEAFKASR
jgi:hypothetical protein